MFFQNSARKQNSGGDTLGRAAMPGDYGDNGLTKDGFPPYEPPPALDIYPLYNPNESDPYTARSTKLEPYPPGTGGIKPPLPATGGVKPPLPATGGVNPYPPRTSFNPLPGNSTSAQSAADAVSGLFGLSTQTLLLIGGGIALAMMVSSGGSKR